MKDERTPGGAVSGIDLGAIAAFRAGRLDRAAQATLADQVAILIGQPEPPATPIASALRRILEGIGGDEALLAWLDGFPGRPRLVARILGLVALLDRFGDRWPVVEALRELRERTPYPPGLAGHLPALTDADNLPGLGGEIKMLLGEEETAAAGRVARAAAGLLCDLAPRVARAPGLEDLGSLAERAERGISEALRAYR
ncbi:hypothetical protein [Dactylosporangium sp. CA-092794]|uniref:hypothetical protein n=1 Tax=Dactylosporangium sp. CA-092794 TaxID=3239929 RepID=UPI003D92C0E4